jgi:hypothetical protein
MTRCSNSPSVWCPKLNVHKGGNVTLTMPKIGYIPISSSQLGESPLPDPRRWTALMALAAVEVSVGLRPAAQLTRWLAPAVYGAIARRGVFNLKVHSKPIIERPIVRSVRTCELSPGIIESSAVVHDGRKTRAVAMRLEAKSNRWYATELSVW